MVLKDKGVTEYINRFSGEQKKILEKLRKILLSLKVPEKMYVGVPWYGRFYLYGGKHGDVNLGVSVKGMKKEAKDKLKGKGKMMRHLKFKSLSEIDEKEVKGILKEAGKCVEC